MTSLRAGILIPAYRCAASIGDVVRGAARHGLPVLVVDDGSDDGTERHATAAGAEVVRHAANRGKGVALRTGMRHLAARGLSHALSMDADGQHLPHEIPHLLAVAERTPEAIVIGRRTIGGQAVASANLLGNRVANLAVRLATGVDAGDTQSGFRVYPLASVLRLPARGDRFEYETTIIVHALRCGIPVQSVPVDVYYPPISERRTHYRKVMDTLRIIRAMAPLLLRR